MQYENEKQRAGRNKHTLVNHSYILSGAYRRKFDLISKSSVLNKLVYQCARKMLEHRSGTMFEDMYWIDVSTNSVVAREINCIYYENGYAGGLVICHNGKIYMYSSNKKISKEYYQLTVAEYMKQGYNENEAQIYALNELQGHFAIRFKEVTA